MPGWLLAGTFGAAAADGEHRTALCQEVVLALDSGAEKREIKQIIEDAPSVDAADSKCLNRKRFPSYVGRKAQAELVKRGGLEALPTAPLEVWAVVPDPRKIAQAQDSWLEWAGGVACEAGYFRERVDGEVKQQVLRNARAALAEEGVAGHVEFGPVPLDRVTGIEWSSGAAREKELAPGTWWVLRISIPDAVAAARASKGDFVVGIGARVGMDIQAEVRETVRRQVWDALNDNNVRSIVLVSP